MLNTDVPFHNIVEGNMVYKILNASHFVLCINIRVTSNGSYRFFNSCIGLLHKDSSNSFRTGKSKRK